ncbi:MAG: acetylornithine deacetylase, partial [Alistipes sp.]|nr:acetylornithine deacetylase [Alistipes sp.]
MAAPRRLVAMGKVPFGSPTMSNQAVMPFITLKLGAGESSRSHTADEYILLREIEEAVELYYALLDGLKIEKQ